MHILGMIGLVILLWFIWVFSGGPQNYDPESGPYIKPPAPIGTGETYGPDL